MPTRLAIDKRTVQFCLQGTFTHVRSKIKALQYSFMVFLALISEVCITDRSESTVAPSTLHATHGE